MVKVATPKKEKITEAVLDKEFSAIEATSVKKEAEKDLNKNQLAVLKRVAYYVGKVGMDLDEACMLIGVDPIQFREEMVIHPVIQRIINMKELEYKKDMMATLSARARNGDDKVAQWLLEMKDPDKYGKKKSGPDGAEDMMAAAIDYIQTENGGGLVKTTSGRAIVVKKKGEQKMKTEDILKKIHQIAKP